MWRERERDQEDQEDDDEEEDKNRDERQRDILYSSCVTALNNRETKTFFIRGVRNRKP